MLIILENKESGVDFCRSTGPLSESLLSDGPLCSTYYSVHSIASEIIHDGVYQGLLQDGETASDQHDGEEIVACFHASWGPLVLAQDGYSCLLLSRCGIRKKALPLSGHVSGTGEPVNHLFLASRFNPEGCLTRRIVKSRPDKESSTTRCFAVYSISIRTTQGRVLRRGASTRRAIKVLFSCRLVLVTWSLSCPATFQLWGMRQ